MAFGRSKTTEPAPQPRRTAPTEGSLIAAGMVLDGDCESDGAIRVDGHVTGSVRAARLTVGTGGRVDGDVTGVDDGGAEPAVVVEGTVGGGVRAHRVEVGPQGSVGGGLTVSEAVVRGHVLGAVETENRLVLEETAVVEGDVTAPRLGLKEGGRVSGTIRIGEAGASRRRGPDTSTPSRGVAAAGAKDGAPPSDAPSKEADSTAGSMAAEGSEQKRKEEEKPEGAGGSAG